MATLPNNSLQLIRVATLYQIQQVQFNFGKSKNGNPDTKSFLHMATLYHVNMFK